MEISSNSHSLVDYLKDRHAVRIITYHFISLPFITYIVLSHQYGGGPFNPGLDTVAELLGGLVCIYLILFSLVKTVSKGKEYVFSLVVNIIALGILVLICALA